jgi:hypothetical protein
MGKKETSDDPDWKIGKGFAMIQQGSGLPGLDHSNAWAKLLTDAPSRYSAVVQTLEPVWIPSVQR